MLSKKIHLVRKFKLFLLFHLQDMTVYLKMCHMCILIWWNEALFVKHQVLSHLWSLISLLIHWHLLVWCIRMWVVKLIYQFRVWKFKEELWCKVDYFKKLYIMLKCHFVIKNIPAVNPLLYTRLLQTSGSSSYPEFLPPCNETAVKQNNHICTIFNKENIDYTCKNSHSGFFLIYWSLLKFIYFSIYIQHMKPKSNFFFMHIKS